MLSNVEVSRLLTDTLFRDRTDDIPDQLTSADLDRLLKVAWRNRLTTRFLNKLSASSPEWQEKLAQLIQYQENRREKILAFVEEVNTLFQEEAVSFVLMKTFDNYPDFLSVDGLLPHLGDLWVYLQLNTNLI